ncbi:MAG: D-alanyl-D-alanine carboxypeptidase family protein [Prevotella sp.]|nr:D-alanyl-D-alanine carboxypeptidase family protein [Alistipes senegalensis]MCM1357333.1 D-alanyl-D-alanine carboxypeptidase family protein [Prevotella sp.]MCM1473038.1 D-alanyl-D-alanine carboxypeptidase family protein [Muribaculaceae bacterium]
MDLKKIFTMSLAISLSTLAVIDCNKTENIYAVSEDTAWNLGDINNDGFINAVDSTLILTEYAALSTDGVSTFSAEQKKAADTNNDNLVDSVDATSVLSYYAYKSTGGILNFEKWLENPVEIQTTETTTTSVTETSTTTTTISGYTASIDTSVSTSTSTSISSVDTTTTTTTIVTTTVTGVPAGKISEIRLSKYEMNLKIGELDIAYVTMIPEEVENKEEIWTSSNENIATVDKWGNVIAIGEGTCTVTVTSVDNPEIKAEIKVTVGTNNKINEIRLSKYEMNLEKGETDISYVTMLPDSVTNKDEIWTSSDEKVATVDKWGNVAAVADGTCIITVTSVDNPEIKAEIKVTVGNPSPENKINEIRLSKYEMNLKKGETDISYVTMLPDSVSNKDEIWTSSDENIATVDKWGNVIAINDGTCIVTVISVDNPEIKAEIKVTVGNPVTENKITEIKLSKYEMNLEKGETDISYVTMLPEEVANKDEIWTSSDEKVATVDKWGNVTAVSAGMCTVMVTSVDNPSVKAEIKVTVTDKQSAFQQINGLTYINGILIANKSYSLPANYDPGIDAITVKQFGELSNAAAKEGLNIYLSSGYRSYAYQNTIYNNYVSWHGKALADTFSARAGHSEHQTGLAIDVNTIDDSFADTPEAVWLSQHAHEYGFIIRYPKGKESVTGFKYEPWHIRYLGIEKATEVYNSGLALEEYLGIDSYYH